MELVDEQSGATDGQKHRPFHQTGRADRGECQNGGRGGTASIAQPGPHPCRGSLNASDNAADRRTPHRPGRCRRRIRHTGNDPTSVLKYVHDAPCPAALTV